MSKGAVYVVETRSRSAARSPCCCVSCDTNLRTFEGGSAFLDALPELDPNCVLVDLRMPDIGGLEVQRRLDEAGAIFPVVIMCGHGDLGVAVPRSRMARSRSSRSLSTARPSSAPSILPPSISVTQPATPRMSRRRVRG